MVVIGLLLLLTGFVMNIQVLLRLRKTTIPSTEIVKTPPWLISAGLIVLGIVLITFGSR